MPTEYPVPPTTPEELAAAYAQLVATFTPRGADKEGWSDVEEYVRAAALAMAPTGAAGTAKRLRYLKRHVQFHHRQGAPLTHAALLTPAAVETSIAAGVLARGRGDLADAATTLRRVGRQLVPTAWPTQPQRIQGTPVAAPYTPTEVAAFFTAVAAQRTELKRTRGLGALLLGLGAGLDGRDRHVRGSDVEVAAHAVVVNVTGPRARQVPVRVEFEAALLALAAERGPQPVLGGDSVTRHTSNLTDLRGLEGLPRLHAGRLRSTWLVHHLNRGTPIPALARAAALGNGQGRLAAFALEHGTPLSDDEYQRILRGAGDDVPLTGVQQPLISLDKLLGGAA